MLDDVVKNAIDSAQMILALVGMSDAKGVGGDSDGDNDGFGMIANDEM